MMNYNGYVYKNGVYMPEHSDVSHNNDVADFSHICLGDGPILLCAYGYTPHLFLKVDDVYEEYDIKEYSLNTFWETAWESKEKLSFTCGGGLLHIEYKVTLLKLYDEIMIHLYLKDFNGDVWFGQNKRL